MSEIAYTPFQWGGVELTTLGDMMDAVIEITNANDAQEARNFMEAYRAMNWYADENIGYLIGHLDRDLCLKARALFRKGDKGDHACLSEDWLIENLPYGWTYDCTFTPEASFLIYASEGGAAPRYGPLVIPIRLLADPVVS